MAITPARKTELPPGAGSAGGALRVLQRPSFRAFWFSSWMWNIARWLAQFTGSYLVFHRGGSTLQVQLVGACYFLPMFAVGFAGGMIADRVDRRRALLIQFWGLALLAAAVGADIIAGTAQAWHIYPAMLLLGIGSVGDMTCRRAMLYDIVGPELLTGALALEALSMTGGTLLGNLTAGAIIDLSGTGEAFTAAGVACVLAALALSRVQVAQQHRIAANGTPVRRQVAEGLRYALRNHALIGVLTVTAIINLFFFTYTPLVPAFAKHLHVGAFLAGALGASAGFGSLAGAIVVATGRVPLSRSLIYVCGAALSLAGLLWFASFGSYWLAFAGLLVGGIGQAGFTTMQSALVLSTTPAPLRGRAMGVLSMAIGTLPFGMLALGAVAVHTGIATAVQGSAVVGLTCLALCWAFGRDMRRQIEV